MYRHETKVELALRILRERILTGDLEPGVRLDINEVAGELDMSPTPVREALRVLQSDRLVSYMPHRGTVVAGLSESQLAESFDLRELLEPAAVERAVPRLAVEHMDELEEMHAAVLTEDHRDSPAGFAERNAMWHWVIYNAAGSPFLADFIRRLWDTFPWRAISAIDDRRATAVAEHNEIMDALRARDAQAAAERMRAHIRSSRAALAASDALAPPGPTAATTLVSAAPSPLRTPASPVADEPPAAP